jgi:hypothetical protein
MKFEQGAPDCTWMTNHLMKRKLEFQIHELSCFVQKFNLNSFFLTLAYFELDYSMNLILD